MLTDFEKHRTFMEFEIIVPQTFIDFPEKKYINDCCVGCDEILHKFKDEIASTMNLQINDLEIYQEDWGWALEFSKDDVFYFAEIGNLLVEDKNQTYFSVGIRAARKVKKLFFNQMIEDEEESKRFSEIVRKSADKNGFITN